MIKKKYIKSIEKKIEFIENEAIAQLNEEIKAFCDKNKLGFVSGNGTWKLIEKSGLEKTEIWKNAFYGNGYTDLCLYDGREFAIEEYQKRIKEIADKFRNIYDAGQDLATVLRTDYNILCFCDDYNAEFTKE